MINVRIKPNGDFAFTGNIEKDPADVIDLIVDYTQYFKTDTITTITVTGTNIDIDSSAVASNIVTIFVSGGSAGSRLDGANKNDALVKIKTSSATRTLERTIVIRVTDK